MKSAKQYITYVRLFANSAKKVIRLSLLLIGMVFFFGCTSPDNQTKVSIKNSSWHVNGEPVNAGSLAEGLLMNVRMVNAAFEDESRQIYGRVPDFDPDANTARFVSRIPDYVAGGINAFTISLQGGMPGYEGAVNSAFNADGSLRSTYLNRIDRIIRTADASGAVVILTCFYQRQHSHERALKGRQAIRQAVSNVVGWVSDQQYSNVVLEISNEYAHSGFKNWKDGDWLSSVEGQVELIHHAKAAAPELLVSTSGMGNGAIAEPIARAADFILIHFNNTALADIPQRIEQAGSYGKPVICNEDDKIGTDGAEAARLSVQSGAGWGFMHSEKNQYAPFEFDGPADDSLVYKMVANLTSRDGAASEKLNTMVFPENQWEESTPESQGVDGQKLEEAIQYLEQHAGSDGVRELAIVRNGRLIRTGPDIDRMHNVWSLTKSFTGTALGLLIDDGTLTLDTPASTYVPELSEVYSDVTFRHFATMTSGYTAEGDQPEVSHGQSSTPFIPSAKPLFTPSGSRYAYWDSAVNQFARVLTLAAGEPIEELFRRRIADPIGMDRQAWDWKGFEGEEPVVNGGAGNKGKGIHISARELARFGHLFLNRGRWKEEQLLSAWWVDAATSVQVPASMPLGHTIDGVGVYGYNWWVNDKGRDGRPKWPDAPRGTYAASGYNNNDMFVIPEWSMVVVRLGLDQNEAEITDDIYNTFLRKVGEAVNQ